MEPIPLYDRRTGALTEEVIFEPAAMRFFYVSAFGFALTETLLKHRWATNVYARRMHSPASRAKIKPFIESYGIDVAEIERPLDSFQSFNDFFIRKLKPHARPIDRDPRSLISIADCRLIAYPITREGVYPIKASRFTVAELIGNESFARAYEGGLCLIFRLAPVDYHRFCYVDDCEHEPVQTINGFYRSVHPLSLRRMKAVFTENQRQMCTLKTANFGAVIHIDVGATGVGRIVQNHPAGGRFVRGDEKGYFEFGGSTVILLLQAGTAVMDDDIAEYSSRGIETIVRYGERIGRAAGS